ncbi:MAG: adenylyltransferase/cytidyltransferase family protein [bacterium]
MSTEPRRGVIIGRFMPPHAGHRYLIDFASRYVDELYVLVCTLSSELIPGTLRWEWVSAMFPKARVLHVTEEIPEASRANPGAIQIWADWIRAVTDVDIDYVFASEDYGWELAEALAATYVPVDPARSGFPVSASAIRKDPMAYWEYIPTVVRPFFVQRVAIAEDPAARALAQQLAERLRTLRVRDYYAYWGGLGKRVGSIAEIARAQACGEYALAKHANRVLLCESDPLQNAVRWELAGGEPVEIGHDDLRDYSLILVSNPRSYGATSAREFLDAVVSRLNRLNRSYRMIDPDGVDDAESAVRELMNHHR